ncbi:MAG: hypothetical protein PHQ23_13970 [Candidatus Wallbacteria bacterium]|nr:hypothetical protein [Candidatus Wallbacteria bacterium]
MKFFAVLLAAVMICAPLMADDAGREHSRQRAYQLERDAYKAWLDNFFYKVNDFSSNYTPQELDQLQTLIDTKPPFGAQHYDLWLDKFMYYVDDFGSNYTADEMTVLNILVLSRPDGEVSPGMYGKFLEKMRYYIDDFGSSYTPLELDVLRLIAKCRPESGQDSDYEAWLNMYNYYHDDFGSTYTDMENTVLNIIMSLKPLVNPQGDNPGSVSVPRQTIRRVIEMIRNGNYEKAIQVLDSLLD